MVSKLWSKISHLQTVLLERFLMVDVRFPNYRLYSIIGRGPLLLQCSWLESLKFDMVVGQVTEWFRLGNATAGVNDSLLTKALGSSADGVLSGPTFGWAFVALGS
eukprot:2496014-Amphidinium_carterae.2